MNCLKIKDNVDLKELKKFGFKDCDGIEYDCCDGYRRLCIWCKDRHIFLTNTLRDESYELGLAKLFDLIQAGLVEKIEEIK